MEPTRPKLPSEAVELYNGFNCDATPERYNKAAADLAWQRTTDWFNKYLRG